MDGSLWYSVARENRSLTDSRIQITTQTRKDNHENFKINSENITNIAARIVVAVGIIVLVVVAFKLAAFLLTKILFPLLGGVIQILFEATSWIIPLFLISRTKTFQKAYNAARGKHEEKENKNK